MFTLERCLACLIKGFSIMSTIAGRGGQDLDDDGIDWTSVRPVYRRMHTEFRLLTSAFGIEVDKETRQHLGRLITAIDAVDRHLDGMQSADDRSGFGRSMVSYLSGRSDRLEVACGSKELVNRSRSLKSSIIRRGIQAPFCDTVERILECGEAKRRARSQAVMIHAMREEWYLSGRLTVLTLGSHTNPRFEKFFDLCCRTMSSVDLLQDARDDYRAGQMSVRPNVWLYVRLCVNLFAAIPRLLWRFPKPRLLLRYTLNMLMAEGRQSRASSQRMESVGDVSHIATEAD